MALFSSSTNEYREEDFDIEASINSELVWFRFRVRVSLRELDPFSFRPPSLKARIKSSSSQSCVFQIPTPASLIEHVCWLQFCSEIEKKYTEPMTPKPKLNKDVFEEARHFYSFSSFVFVVNHGMTSEGMVWPLFPPFSVPRVHVCMRGSRR